MNEMLVNVVGINTHTHRYNCILIIDNKSAENTDYINVQGIGI